jgi:branched-chain amino acid transport system substrate-binding protein
MKQGWKKWVAPVAIAAGAAVLAACGSSSSTTPAATDTGAAAGSSTDGAAAGKTLVVSSDLPLTGGSAAASGDTVNAIKLLLKQMNNKAGAYTVEYKSYDDATAAAGAWDTAQCAKNAQDHVANTNEIAVMGTYNSGCAKVEIPILNAANMLMISHANTNPGLTVPWEPNEPGKYYPSGTHNYGRIVIRDDIQGPAGARLAQELGSKNCLVMNDTQTYGVGVARGFVDGAKAIGLTVVDNVGWDAKQSSYRSLFQKWKGKIDCVYLGGIADGNGVTIVKDKVAVLGPNSGDVKLFGPDGMVGYPQLDALPEYEGTNLTFAGKATEQLQKTAVGGPFLTQFQAEYGHLPASPYAIYGAAAMQLILACVAASDGTRADVVAKCFSGITVPAAQSLLGKDYGLDPKTGDIIAGGGDLVYMKAIGGKLVYQKDLAQQ